MKAELLGGGCAGGEGSTPGLGGGPEFAAAWGSVPTEPGVARGFPDLRGKKACRRQASTSTGFRAAPRTASARRIYCEHREAGLRPSQRKLLKFAESAMARKSRDKGKCSERRVYVSPGSGPPGLGTAISRLAFLPPVAVF